MCVVTFAEDIDSSPPASYGAVSESDSAHQRNGVYQSSSVSDAAGVKQWDLKYREAALYLKVDCLKCIILTVGHNSALVSDSNQLMPLFQCVNAWSNNC